MYEAIVTQSALVSSESFALFSTDNPFEISVSISLLLQNLPLLLVRVSLCSLQIIALKLVSQLRYCYKIWPCLSELDWKAKLKPLHAP